MIRHGSIRCRCVIAATSMGEYDISNGVQREPIDGRCVTDATPMEEGGVSGVAQRGTIGGHCIIEDIPVRECGVEEVGVRCSEKRKRDARQERLRSRDLEGHICTKDGAVIIDDDENMLPSSDDEETDSQSQTLTGIASEPVQPTTTNMTSVDSTEQRSPDCKSRLRKLLAQTNVVEKLHKVLRELGKRLSVRAPHIESSFSAGEVDPEELKELYETAKKWGESIDELCGQMGSSEGTPALPAWMQIGLQSMKLNAAFITAMRTCIDSGDKDVTMVQAKMCGVAHIRICRWWPKLNAEMLTERLLLHGMAAEEGRVVECILP